MEKIAVIYGSSTGNTESIAKNIVNLIGENAEAINASKISADIISGYSNLILGTSTWGLGDLQDDWEGSLSVLNSCDLSGKTIALFGLGDSASYPDTFIDGVGTLYKTIKDKECKVIGEVATDSYTFDDSSAIVDGKFIGLPIDEDNESNLTSDRLKQWLDTIIPVFN